MRHSLRGWTVKRQRERLKRKYKLNKFNMSQCVDKTRGWFKTQVGTLICRVTNEERPGAGGGGGGGVSLIYGEYKVEVMDSRDTQSFRVYHSWEVDQRV